MLGLLSSRFDTGEVHATVASKEPHDSYSRSETVKRVEEAHTDKVLRILTWITIFPGGLCRSEN